VLGHLHSEEVFPDVSVENASMHIRGGLAAVRYGKQHPSVFSLAVHLSGL